MKPLGWILYVSKGLHFETNCLFVKKITIVTVVFNLQMYLLQMTR